MKKFAFLILSLINAALTAVYVALSPLEIVPMHYNIDGVADSYSSKWFVMFMPCFTSHCFRQILTSMPNFTPSAFV